MAAAVRIQFAPGANTALAAPLDRRSLRALLTRAVRRTLRRHDIRSGELSVTLLDDDGIQALNRQYLSHEGPTDVISFALFEEGEDLVGDVYVGLDQAARQAEANHVGLAEELVRLCVHGTLHVLGHEHPEGTERLASEMWKVQEEIVSEVGTG